MAKKASTLATAVYTLADGEVRYVRGTDAYDVAKALVMDAKDRLRSDGALNLTLAVTAQFDEDEGDWYFAGTAATAS